jgi:AraC-like DNA-binding protein
MVAGSWGLSPQPGKVTGSVEHFAASMAQLGTASAEESVAPLCVVFGGRRIAWDTAGRKGYECIATLAFEAGFGDLSGFHRTFKAKYGQSPQQLCTAGGSAIA